MESLAKADVTTIATKMLEGHMLRAVARIHHGGAVEVFLERVDFGDEAQPFVLKRQVLVEGINASDVSSMTWEDDRVSILTGADDAKPREYVVRATSESFESKAIRR